MRAEQVYQKIRRQKIIAIARGVDESRILNVAEAVFAAGIKIFEVTCNTEGAFGMLKELCKKLGDKMLIGAGTVITAELCEKALGAGAKYIIAPDVNPNVIDYCVSRDIAVLPGAATATEILTAKRHSASMVKIFPAAAIGADYIKQLRGPIDDVDFVAVGGVSPDNIKDFFDAGCIAVAVGGSVIRKEFIDASNWPAITELARQYVKSLPL